MIFEILLRFQKFKCFDKKKTLLFSAGAFVVWYLQL